MPNLISRLRTLVWKAKNFRTFQESEEAGHDLAPDGPRTEDWNEATLVLSKFRELRFHNLHWPVLDLDVPCHLIPSTHEGHFHLVIEHPMEWGDYKRLLLALCSAGLLQHWFVQKSIERGYTAIRRPGVLKQGHKETSASSHSRGGRTNIQIAFSVYNAIEYALAVGQDDDLVREQLRESLRSLHPIAKTHPDWEI